MNKSEAKYGELYCTKMGKRLEIECLSNLKGSKIISICENKKNLYIITENSSKMQKITEISKDEKTSLIEKEFMKKNKNSIIDIIFENKRKMYRTKENELFVIGEGELGSLGLGSSNKENEPKNILNKKNKKIKENEINNNFGNKKIRKIVCGTNHSILLMEDGDIKVWGSGFNGQLGLSFSKLSALPIYLPFFEKLKKKVFRNKKFTNSLNSVKYIEFLEENEKKRNYEKIISVFAAGDHSFGLTNLGNLYVWGDNIYGQLGIKNKKSFIPEKLNFEKKIIKVSCSETHTLLLTNEGDIFSCGLNNYGQLGLGEIKNSKEFIKLEKDDENKILPKFKEIKSNFKSSIALDIKNNIYYWGKSILDKKITKLPKKFNYLSKNIPEISDIYITKNNILLFSSLKFDLVTPNLISSEGGSIIKIKGYGLAQFSENQLVRFSTKEINYNIKEENLDLISENSEKIEEYEEIEEINKSEEDLNLYVEEEKEINCEKNVEKDLIKEYQIKLNFDEDKNCLKFISPCFDLSIKNWSSIKTFLEISLDGEIWKKTDLEVFIYNSKSFELSKINPEIFSVEDKQNIEISINRLGFIPDKFFENLEIGFKKEKHDEIIKKPTKYENNIFSCEIPKFKNEEINYFTEIFLFPNGQQIYENKNKIFLKNYKVEFEKISPFNRIEGDFIIHKIEGKGLFNSKKKKIMIKGPYKEILVDLDYDSENNSFSFKTKFYEDLFIENIKEEEQKKLNENIDEEIVEIKKDEKIQEKVENLEIIEKDEKFIKTAKIMLTLCGNYWFDFGEIKFSKTKFEKIMVAPLKQKKENPEDYKNRIFKEEIFEYIDPELNPKKQEKLKKEILKTKTNLINNLLTNIIRPETIIWIEGKNFLEKKKIFIKIKLLNKDKEEYKIVDIEGFVKNQNCFVFELPFFYEENFDVMDLFVSFSFNNVQFIDCEGSFKFLIIKKDLDDVKELNAFIKAYGKIKK